MNSSHSANSKSVAKMLGSIQDLQQQFHDITIEEITEAEEKAQKLLQKLANLQKHLEAFQEIKKRLAGVSGILRSSQEERLQPAKIEDMETVRSPNVATPHPSNLILFPVSHRSSKDADTSYQPVPSLIHQVTNQPPETEPKVQVNSDQPSVEKPEERAIHGGANSAGAEPADPAVIPDYEDFIEESRETSATSDTTSLLSAATRQDEPAEPEFSIDEKPESSSSGPPASLDFKGSFESENRTEEIDGIHPALDLNIDLDSPQPDDACDDRIEFDQRLLDDLIKDYGEFVSYSNLSHAVDGQTDPREPQAESTPEVIEAVKTAQITNEKAIARYRADGDLDRQLKKLIKDYGEYDLYPQRNSEYLKKGVIVAFLMLGLIFTGLYFGFPRQRTRSVSIVPAVKSNTNSTSPGLPRDGHSSLDVPKPLTNAAPPQLAVPAVSDAREPDLFGGKKFPERKE